MQLESPHIPLGISLDEGLNILESLSSEIEKRTDKEDEFYKIVFDNWECGFYERKSIVTSTWYNDSAGRETEEGINSKVTRYLNRYGEIDDWEAGISNGWIQFFINHTSGVNMAYGLHKDVIRFNSIR
ncbi:hypothetical protein AN944_00921 [Shewanella sp. P1-14-1]|uniref:hypothetical protein n=1 Tax=Shewanella sp. P1-14-1 TaxID=1723761 RepID=UPI0006D66500|nr:hypothetical protein [Shewanella sp. P1-14-1]KPZ72679.1 hypothetical protein AN944_00921 [Shewanella sp. P1-14-1]